MNRYGVIGFVLVASLACSGGGTDAPTDATNATNAPTSTSGGPAEPAAPLVAGPPPAIAGGCTPGAPEVTYKGGLFTATYCPNVTADGEVYAGATVIKEDGTRHDLKFVTIPLDQRGIPVTITEYVGAGYEGWSTVVWKAAQTCTPAQTNSDESDGCKLYGKQLWGVLWSTPAWDEWDDMPFEEWKPVRVQLVDAGGGPEGLAAVKAAAGKLPVVDGGTANTPRDYIDVMYRRPRFRGQADDLASKLPGHVTVREWRDAPEALVVAVGK